MLSSSFTCRIIFGLGITSVTDFIALASKYKPIKEAGYSYVTANSTSYNRKVGLVIFDGVRELFKFHKYIREHQIIVVSEIPTILKEVTEIIPLDFDQQRSFEFNFKEIDIHIVLRALRSKTLKITSNFTSFSNIGYHIERVKNTSELMASYISLTSNLPFDKRTLLRRALLKFFKSKKINKSIVSDSVKDICKDFNLKEEVASFIGKFNKEAEIYHQGVNHAGAVSVVAKQLSVDQYTLAYLRKLVRSFDIVDERNRKSNVAILG